MVVGARFGLLPKDIFHMTLSELNIYFYEKSLVDMNNETSLAWKITNFVNLSFAGKLKDLADYLIKHKDKKRQEQSIKDKVVKSAMDQAKQLGDIPSN